MLDKCHLVYFSTNLHLVISAKTSHDIVQTVIRTKRDKKIDTITKNIYKIKRNIK